MAAVGHRGPDERDEKGISERAQAFLLAPAGILVARGPALVVDLVNPAFRALAPGAAIEGRPLAEVMKGMPDVARLAHRAVRTDKREEALHIALESGRFATVSCVPLHGDGANDGVLLFALPETEAAIAAEARSRREQEAEQRVRELQAIFESMADGVFVVDADHRFTVANTYGSVLHGLRPEDVLDRRISDFPEALKMRHADGRPMKLGEHPLQRALAGETVTDLLKIVFNAQTGRDVWFRVNAAPVHGPDGKIVAAVEIARDVTELLELETVKDEFIRVAAHELKTPVTIVKAYAQELLRTGADMPEPRRRMLEAIDRGTGRLARLAEHLVEVSQLHIGRTRVMLERIDLAELVEHVVAVAALEARRHRVVITHLDPVVVLADRERLNQILTSLIDNAVLYSPDGGDVEVSVAATDHRAVLSVTDHGIGIPRERQERIFQRFYRAHSGTPHDYGGMGVSLYIARETVRLMGGEMNFESEPGKGSRFFFDVPLMGAYGASPRRATNVT